jgi:hypothetical protein
MRWLIVAIALVGLAASLASYNANGFYTGAERRLLGLVAVTALIVVVVMAVTLV